MQIQITGHQFEVTAPIKDYINNKLPKLEKHFDHITNAHVTLHVEKERQIAKAKVNISGSELIAEAVNGDMYASIDLMMDKLDRQIIKYKEKLKDHHKQEKAPEMQFDADEE